MFVMGIDLGTQGARVIITDLEGQVNSEATSDFPLEQIASSSPGCFEQELSVWRQALDAALAQAVGAFVQAGNPPEALAALSVTSTSGTVCLMKADGEPVGPAIMYSDSRASRAAAEVQALAGDLAAKLGTGFTASFALSKLRWLQQEHPERLEQARWFLSPTDLVIGWLTGDWGHTDWTNALKWGYDVIDLRWPELIERDLGLPLDKFPTVQAPGTPIGRVTAKAAARAGLRAGTPVMAGSTDGTASQLASGAVRPGDWNSTLGTTLVLKGVSERLLRDPLGRIYCHRHPDGYWLPGGASSTGADCLTQRFASQHLEALNRTALAHSPTDLIIYPLMRRGERFPFTNPDATGFCLGETGDEATYFAAHLEGIAYVERLAYEVIEGLGAPVGDMLSVAGGGTRSLAGLQIRADVLGKSLRVPQVPSGAMGAAILAARGHIFPSLGQAAAQMIHYERVVEPRPAYRPAYMERYARFLDACRARGYLP